MNNIPTQQLTFDEMIAYLSCIDAENFICGVIRLIMAWQIAHEVCLVKHPTDKIAIAAFEALDCIEVSEGRVQ